MNKKIKRHLPTLLILVIGIVITALLAGDGDEAVPPPLIRERPLVQVRQAVRGPYSLRIPGWGIVEPREILDLRTESEGRVTEVAEQLRPGGRFAAGDLLFALEPRDATYRLAQARAERDQAVQALRIESGRQAIARAEWDLLDPDTADAEDSRDLALRLPQLKEREAVVEVAEARVKQAELELERTRIIAPCDGQILREDVGVGRVLDPEQTALTFLCTQTFRILVAFPPDYRIDTTGGPVTVKAGTHHLEGRLLEVLQGVDSETRQRQALVEIDPVEGLLGAYAELLLPGQTVTDGFPLPRSALREDSTLWILTPENQLERRPVDVLARDGETVVIGQGLAEGEWVILSHMASPLEGMALKMNEQTEGTE